MCVLLPNIDQQVVGWYLMAILGSWLVFDGNTFSRWPEAEDGLRLSGKSLGSLLPARTPDKSGENLKLTISMLRRHQLGDERGHNLSLVIRLES